MAIEIKKLLTRSISGLIYIGIIIGCILCGRIGILSLSVVLGAVASIEFTKITKGLTPRTIPILIADIAGVVCLAMGFWFFPLILWVFCMVWRLVLELYSNEKDPIRSLAYSFMIQLYIGLPMLMMNSYPEFFGVPHLLLAIFAMIWINDTGAFLVGCTLGRHKLFERISPKKTWEGFIGGLAFCVGFGVICAYCFSGFFEYGTNVWHWVGLAAVVSIFGTWGDLIESLMKRNLHIKDSGNIIPGHGGILDRIDSLLLVLPATFLYIFLLEWCL